MCRRPGADKGSPVPSASVIHPSVRFIPSSRLTLRTQFRTRVCRRSARTGFVVRVEPRVIARNDLGNDVVAGVRGW